MWRTGPFKFHGIDPEDLKEEFQLKTLRHTEYKLTWEQKVLLKKCGTRMQAYMDGKLIPIWWNRKGKHFVAMCNNLVEPCDGYERIWKSYLLTLKEEERLKEIHRAKLAQENEQQLQSLYLSGDGYVSGEALSNKSDEQIGQDQYRRTKRCPRCRGQGYDCPRCDGRGEIEVD